MQRAGGSTWLRGTEREKYFPSHSRKVGLHQGHCCRRPDLPPLDHTVQQQLVSDYRDVPRLQGATLPGVFLAPHVHSEVHR